MAAKTDRTVKLRVTSRLGDPGDADRTLVNAFSAMVSPKGLTAPERNTVSNMFRMARQNGGDLTVRVDNKDVLDWGDWTVETVDPKEAIAEVQQKIADALALKKK